MYKLHPYGYIIQLPERTLIPTDPDNVEYQKYLKWVEAGNTPEPADEG